jgi:hypothetical protein
MITLRDTLTLSLTKLRTRKVRLVITIIVSGLLFTALVGGSLIFRGSFASIESFSSEGLGKRFIVSAYDSSSSDNIFAKPEVISRAKEIQKDTIARKKAEAKKLDIAYDPQTEESPVYEFDGPNGKEQNVSPESQAGKQAIAEYINAHPPRGVADFKKVADPYKPIAIHSSQTAPYTTDSSWQILKDGKESYAIGGAKDRMGPPRGLDSFTGLWSLMSADLLQPFALKGQSLKLGDDGSIPIVVPVSASEELLGLKALPATATSDEKLARTKEIREKAPKLTFNLCYRNASSSELINTAISTQQEIERNKNNKEYTKPELIYGLPKTPCGEATVTRDVRSADQKKLDAKQLQFAETFGKQKPAQAIISFRVVGVVPDFEFQNAAGIGQILGSLVGSSLGTGWFTPLEESIKNPIIAAHFDAAKSQMFGSRPTMYAEFKDSKGAKTFIDKASCSPEFETMMMGGGAGIVDPYKECNEQGKLYSLSAYGSNSLALEDTKREFGKFFGIGALVVAAIGSIIMMGTVGRMIADSRRETAVFRAIGAKRFDIAQIYLVYTFLVSLLISIFAVTGGIILAILFQNRYAEGLTVQALVAYNAQDLDKTFSLFSLYLPDILLLVGLAVGISLISVSIPLLRNVRRNPIRDMRDEN